MATENNTDASSTENADHSTEYRRLIELGIALSAELDHNKLMESILLAAKEFCNADAGTLYLMSNDNELGFQIIRNDSLGIALGGTTGKDIDFPAVKIFDENGEPNLNNVSAAAAIRAASKKKTCRSRPASWRSPISSKRSPQPTCPINCRKNSLNPSRSWAS